MNRGKDDVGCGIGLRVVDGYRRVVLVCTIRGLKSSDGPVSPGSDVWCLVGVPPYGHDHVSWSQQMINVSRLEDVLSEVYRSLQILYNHCSGIQAVVGACVRGED